ncbi:MAG: Nramp family divalent metal transporter [Bacteroidales bacterium]|nr:Nramp family divalent metal transporter [Bacteroidales bacterium]
MSGKKLSAWIHTIGPGLIVAALVFGPSKLTITSKIGANFQYGLLWIIIIAIFFMAIYTLIAERIGLASDRSLLSMIGEKWGKGVAKIVGFGIFLVCASFQTGNSVGVGIAIGELTNTDNIYWIIVFNLIGILLLFFRNFYKVLEKVMISLVGLMLVAFIITLIEVKPNVVEVVKGLFIPRVPDGSVGLIVAFMASCFSIVGAFYTSYLVQERKKISGREKTNQSSSLTGIFILGLLSAIVMISAGAILSPLGIEVKTATDMSLALKPAFGDYASAVFLIGLFAAGFSSIIGNASIGGTLLSDALGYGSNFSSKKTRGIIALVMVIGGVIAIIFGGAPLELIVFAQSITIFIVPIIGIAIFLISNDKVYMGELISTPFLKITGAVGLVLVVILAVINFIDIFLK